MKAIRIHFRDNGDELRIEEVPQPDPKADEVLIRAQAIGVNRADLNRRRTAAPGDQEPSRIPGLDVAGVVASVGADVTNWHPGDHVMGLVRGAYAEYSVAPSVLTFCPPAGMSTTDAASLPCVFLPAWYAFQLAGPESRSPRPWGPEFSPAPALMSGWSEVGSWAPKRV